MAAVVLVLDHNRRRTRVDPLKERDAYELGQVIGSRHGEIWQTVAQKISAAIDVDASEVEVVLSRNELEAIQKAFDDETALQQPRFEHFRGEVARALAGL